MAWCATRTVSLAWASALQNDRQANTESKALVAATPDRVIIDAVIDAAPAWRDVGLADHRWVTLE
jgi:hypothetical protein